MNGRRGEFCRSFGAPNCQEKEYSNLFSFSRRNCYRIRDVRRGGDKGSCARHVLAYAHGTFLRYPLCRTLLVRVADLESLLSGNISGRVGRILQGAGLGHFRSSLQPITHKSACFIDSLHAMNALHSFSIYRHCVGILVVFALALSPALAQEPTPGTEESVLEDKAATTQITPKSLDDVFASESGDISTSIDGVGTNNSSATVQVDKQIGRAHV